ncbi:MAG: VOC family protein [Porticoccaceae bacterium]|nr:MAG: VOC family protein [Porticoccaceae bacterium]
MINYITLGTNDLDRAGKFYDELLAVVGGKRALTTDRSVGWVGAKGAPMLMIMKPFDGKPATPGNGTMVALTASSPEQVAAIHAKALALGGTDEGTPGPRGEGAFHCGYFRDLDGNKFNAFFMKR